VGFVVEAFDRYVLDGSVHALEMRQRSVEAARMLTRGRNTELLPVDPRPVDERLTYGHRRIAALLGWEQQAQGWAVINRKRVDR